MTTLKLTDEALATLQGIDSLTMSGKDLHVMVRGAHTDSTLVRSITGISTLSLDLLDNKRKIAKSGIFGDAVTIHAGVYQYSATAITKSGDTLTVEFEDAIAARLQAINSPFKVAAGVTNHVDFVRSLIRPIKWLKFMTIPRADYNKYKVQTSLTPLYRGTPPAGTTAGKTEGTWSAINRIGTARGWRIFIRGTDELWYVPDAYLFSVPTGFTMSEDHAWVNDIDYDLNIRKKVATATATVVAAQYGIPAGVVVMITDTGPTHGKWLVQDITRQPISNPLATVTLIHPQPILPEPVPDSTSGSGGVDGSGTASISTNGAIAVAQYAIRAGFSGSNLLTAVEVSFAEDSSHDPTVFSRPNSDGSIDRGLWQINNKAHSKYLDADMRDGQLNANAAWAISNHGKNWDAWTTYNNGAYARYRSQAESAIASAQKIEASNGATVGTGHGGVAPSRTTSKLAADFVNEVLSQKDKSYQMGASDAPSNPNPKSFDCSSLMQWGAARVGVSIPRTAELQYEACVKAGTAISAARAMTIRGALLFEAGSDPEGTYGIGHVAMSMGNSKETFEALGTSYGVNEFGDAHNFTRGGLVPGMKY